MSQDNEPVTQGEFATTMGAIKQDLDQLATKSDLETLREEMATWSDLEDLKKEMATKAEVAELRQITVRILDLIEGIDAKLKPLQGLPEDVHRLKEAVFH